MQLTANALSLLLGQFGKLLQQFLALGNVTFGGGDGVGVAGLVHKLGDRQPHIQCTAIFADALRLQRPDVFTTRDSLHVIQCLIATDFGHDVTNVHRQGF